MKRVSDIERFWSKVDKNGPIPEWRADLGNCWVWTRSLNMGGYGYFFAGGRTVVAHKYLYQLENGLVPKGMELDHLCRVVSCVRPDHIEAVTHRENVLRSRGVGALRSAQTHCVNGHEFTPDNTRLRGHRRQCKTCESHSYRATRKIDGLNSA